MIMDGSNGTKLGPFEFLNSINYSKRDIMDVENETHYNSYMVNRGLSYSHDTVLLANEMNRYWDVDSKLQYHFLLNIVRKRKRFPKWVKPETLNDIEAVKEYYGYSNDKARQVLPLLSPDSLNKIKNKVQKGGRK